MNKNPILERVIRTASRAYPDGLVADCHKRPGMPHGDSLALFVALELGEVCAEAKTLPEAYAIASGAMSRAADELREVADAMERSARRTSTAALPGLGNR